MYTSLGKELALKVALLQPGTILHFLENKHFETPKSHFFVVLNKCPAGPGDVVYVVTATSQVQAKRDFYAKSSWYSAEEVAKILFEIQAGTLCFTSDTLVVCEEIYDYSYDELKEKLLATPPISIEGQLPNDALEKLLDGVLIGRKAPVGWLKKIAADNGRKF